MMLHPSYSDLIDVVNEGAEEGEKVVNSRYSIVMAVSKRARQLIDGEMPLVAIKNGEKPLSTAIDELSEGKLKILPQQDEEEESEEETLSFSDEPENSNETSQEVSAEDTVQE